MQIRTTPNRILVACHDIVMSGGLMRLERFGREIRKSGSSLSFLLLGENTSPEWQSEFDCVHLEEAAEQYWDATMVPGSGFPEETINKFSLLRASNFGVRVQHVLNDQTIRERFLKVNGSFQPDVVVFNNRHWEPGSFTDFQAAKFAFLEGAVDAVKFSPSVYRTFPSADDEIYIGALANKNPMPLLRALDQLPDRFKLIMIGRIPHDPGEVTAALQTHMDAGRLDCRGIVNERDLRSFYKDIDCVVHTETHAGWANVAAEALACGLPLVCTKHGTMAFAKHGHTALVLNEATPAEIADHVRFLFSNRDFTYNLAANGREVIAEYSWQDYARELSQLCVDDGKFHYTFAPELGLHGKWPLSNRFQGVTEILDRVEGQTVIDFGAAEGVISLECLKRGAAAVHGFEFDRSRVETATSLCGEYSNCLFRQADLSDWDAFLKRHADVLLPAYGVVLYLGLQHHLPYPQRIDTLRGAAALAENLFIIRTGDQVYEMDDIASILGEFSLYEIDRDAVPSYQNFGKARVFKKSLVTNYG